MSKIYVTTKGTHSDYCIVGVFSTKEKADAVAAAYSGTYDEPKIEEYELDHLADQLAQGRIRWLVCMLEDGSQMHEPRKFQDGTSYDPNVHPLLGEGYGTEVTFFGPNVSHSPGKLTQRWFYLEVWARDKQHAIKIANEKRIEALAMEKLK